MVSSSTHSVLLLLFPLLMLLSTVAVTESGSAGSVPTAAPADTEEKYEDMCKIYATDSPSCIKVTKSIPGIQEVEDKYPDKIAKLCLHFAANKTTEAKGAADTLLAAAKGKPSGCLKVCAANINEMAEVFVNLHAGQADMDAYLTFIKSVRAKFKYERPPPCEKDCWNKTSSADETGIVDKFHDIWYLVKVGNMQINHYFPFTGNEEDDEDNML